MSDKGKIPEEWIEKTLDDLFDFLAVFHLQEHNYPLMDILISTNLFHPLCWTHMQRIMRVVDPKARDCGELIAGGYRLERLTGYDFYPQTAHIESLAVFRR
jgi:hypothetical protein